MYHRDMNWNEYLATLTFTDEITHSQERQTEAINQMLAQGFGGLIATQEEMMELMCLGFTTVAHGIERVSAGIEGLRSDFDWAMGELLWKQEINNMLLEGILEAILHPLDARARNLRERGQYAYENKWYKEALADLLAVEEENYQDFLAHMTIANIYLYQLNPADLGKAKEYYLKAGKYAEPRSVRHAALAYLQAGFTCYLQSDDESAIKYARQATELYPEFTEAFYGLAKFAAAAKRGVIATTSLERAIRIDRNYAIKARADVDFENIEEDVTRLMKRLHEEAKQQALREWEDLRSKMKCYIVAGKERSELESNQRRIDGLISLDTYFSYTDALGKINECEEFFDSLRLPERDRLTAEIRQLLENLQSEVLGCTMPDSLKQEQLQKLSIPTSLSKRVRTFCAAEGAYESAREYERQWKECRGQFAHFERMMTLLHGGKWHGAKRELRGSRLPPQLWEVIEQRIRKERLVPLAIVVSGALLLYGGLALVFGRSLDIAGIELSKTLIVVISAIAGPLGAAIYLISYGGRAGRPVDYTLSAIAGLAMLLLLYVVFHIIVIIIVILVIAVVLFILGGGG